MLNKRTISNKKLQEEYPEVFYHLNKFYPVGIHNGDERYAQSEQIQRLHGLIKESVINVENYTKQWKKGFCEKVSKELNMEIIPSTAGIVPCRSAYAVLDRDQSGHSTLLCFDVSLIFNYYYIEIAKMSSVVEVEFPSTGISKLPGAIELTVSPYGKYEEKFRAIEKLIQKNFNDASFLPYTFELMQIKGLEVGHSSETNSSVHEAFFAKNRYVDRNVKVFGDIEYSL